METNQEFGEIVELRKQVEDNARLIESYRLRYNEYQNKITNLRQYLLDNANDMDEEHVEGIADIFSLTLEKDVNLVITVELNITATVPLGYEDWYEFANDLDIDVTNPDYEVERSSTYVITARKA